MEQIDLLNPHQSYMLGLFQTDGHLSGLPGGLGSGVFKIALQAQDEPVLLAIQNHLPFPTKISRRTIDTNFKSGYEEVSLTVYRSEARAWINELGVPVGRKSGLIGPPSVPFSEVDYYRGVMDGDGSLGMTRSVRVIPFVSLVTTSESLKDGYTKFITTVVGVEKSLNRNARDHVYNICLYREHAQQMVAALYYDGCLCLPRKMEHAIEVTSWVRPETMKMVSNRRRWSQDEDEVVLSYPVDEASKLLGRSCSSVLNRRFRLRQVTDS